MLKFKLTAACLFVGLFSCNAQTENTAPEAAIKAKNSSKPYENPPKEAVLNLEEQGFTAVVILDKTVYRKEVNGIIVEFIPQQ